jgi:hypothetical protein
MPLPSIAHSSTSGQRQSLRGLAGAFQSGIATLAGGTITVTGVRLTTSSRIMFGRNTPGGMLGELSAPAASRNAGAGSFVINSANAGDTSTVDWLIVG